jgi:hypothetical protein
VALVGSGVTERLACNRDEPPVVRAGAEVELEDARRTQLHNLQSGGLTAEDPASARIAPGPHDELADTVLPIYYAPGG